MTQKRPTIHKIHRGLDDNTKTSGVTVYGINTTADAFDPLFHVKSKTEAEVILQKMCRDCRNRTCPDWTLDIGPCYSIIEHDI